MRFRERGERLAKQMAKAAPTSLRGWAGRASRRFRSGYGGPLVSVILPVSDDVTTKIGPCLDSLRMQSHRNLDIVVVPHGRSSKVLATVARHAEQDWRIRVVPAVDGGLAAARNAGAARARGSHLLFISGGDDVLPYGVARLVRSLAKSGSQMAVGMLEAPKRSATVSTEAPYDTAHRVLRRGATLETAPVAITDLGLGNRLIQKAFWEESGFAFTEEIPTGADVALASYAKASSFDLLTMPTYVVTRRRDAAIGTIMDAFGQLEDWLEDHEAIWQAVEDLQLPAARDWWLWATLDVAVQPFFDDLERADHEQWRTLQDLVERILDTVDDRTWQRLRAESRIKLWLAQNGHREALQRYVASRWFENGNRPTRVDDGRVFAVLPVPDGFATQMPDDTFEMGPAETPLRAVLHNVEWVDDHTLGLELHCRIDYVGMNEAPEVHVALALADDPAKSFPLTATVRRDLQANHRDGHRYQDYSWGVVDVQIPVGDFVASIAHEPVPVGAWDVLVELRTQGIARSGRVDTIDDRGAAGMMGTGQLAARRVEGFRVRPVRPDHGGVQIEVLSDLDSRLLSGTVQGRRVSGTIDPGGQRLVEIRATMARGLRTQAALVPSDGGLEFELQLPPPWAGGQHRVWTLRALTENGEEVPLAWPDDGPPLWLATGEGAVVLSRSPLGEVAVLEAERALVLEDVRFGDDAVEVKGHWLGVAPRGARLALEGRRTGAEVALRTAADGTVSARLETRWDEWGFGPAPWPLGRYWFALVGVGADHRVLVSPQLLQGLLETSWTATYRARPIRLGWAAGVHLQAPLAEDEIGAFAQRSMQLEALREQPLEEKSVYLQSYVGASATDSQLAIHHELRRSRPDLTIHWGVADRSSWVPEGGVPVLMRSRRWYELLGRAGHLCLNIDVDRWYHTKPGQRLLQTFHGYPAKSMGIRMWQAKGATPLRIEHELARTSGDWDLILTPAPEMDQYYRREYAYDGEIHSAGYPRTDMLVGPDAARLREETRKRLGLRADQKAVLYAPTWRDDQATTWRQAELVSHLDLEHASRALGPDYVLLMRGHRFHTDAENRAPNSAGILDVSSYPEINHLILAADAAVLDYSSLRFDFALTDKPMIFLVPDLGDYVGGVRGFLYDYADTAPGPMVDTADEVVAMLRDLESLTSEHAAARAAFHQKYNYWMDGHAAERVVAAFFR